MPYGPAHHPNAHDIRAAPASKRLPTISDQMELSGQTLANARGLATPRKPIRPLFGILLIGACLLVFPIRSRAILCEVFSPCGYLDESRFIFVGTVKRIDVERRTGWNFPERVAYFKVDERLAGTIPRHRRLAFFDTGYQRGEQYLIVGGVGPEGIHFKDDLFVEWRGAAYRGFQTTAVCGPAFRIAADRTDSYLSYFRSADTVRKPVIYGVSVDEEFTGAAVADAAVRLTGKAGNYEAETDEDGNARFKVPPGKYKWEVLQDGRPRVPADSTSKLTIFSGSCSSKSLAVMPSGVN